MINKGYCVPQLFSLWSLTGLLLAWLAVIAFDLSSCIMRQLGLRPTKRSAWTLDSHSRVSCWYEEAPCPMSVEADRLNAAGGRLVYEVAYFNRCSALKKFVDVTVWKVIVISIKLVQHVSRHCLALPYPMVLRNCYLIKKYRYICAAHPDFSLNEKGNQISLESLMTHLQTPYGMIPYWAYQFILSVREIICLSMNISPHEKKLEMKLHLVVTSPSYLKATLKRPW